MNQIRLRSYPPVKQVPVPHVLCAVACKDAAASNAMSIFFIRNLQFVAKIRKTVQLSVFIRQL